MKKKKRLTAIATGIFAMLLMVGCSKAEDIIEEKPAEPEQSEKNEEKPVEKETIRGQVTDLTVRKDDPNIAFTTLKYTGGVTGSLAKAPTNNAETLNLSTSRFSVLAYQGDDSATIPGFNRDNYIVLYSKASSATGNGSYIEVSIIGDYQITSISIDFNYKKELAAVKVGDDVIEERSGEYIIDSTSFIIQNINVGDGGTTKQTRINSVTINYEAAAKDVAGELETQTALSYSYSASPAAIDTLVRTNTLGEGTTAAEWTTSPFASGIVYAGKSGGQSATERMTFNNTNPSGLVTTINANEYFAKKIVITWNSNTPHGRQLDIYGKDAPYGSSADLYNSSKGTLIGSFVYDENNANKEFSLTVSEDYKYIGIRCSAYTLYLDSIEIQWGVDYDYSNVAIRFGGLIKKPLWDRLENIQGYGVMVAADDKVDDALKNHYNAAKVNEACAGEDIKNFYTPLTLEKTNPAGANADQKPDDGRVYYIWNLYQRISNSSLTKSVTSVAYIKLASEVVFLQEVTTSVKELASELMSDPLYDEESFDGSLNNLATLA